MLPLIILGIVAILIPTVSLIIVAATSRRNKEIDTNGICVDSVVVLNERKDKYYRTVIRFTGDDGQEHDCALQYRGGLPVGRKIKAQYIPGCYDEVVFVSQEIGSENL